MVEAFKKRGSSGGRMDVTLVETADHVLPTMLDNYPCQSAFKKRGSSGGRMDVTLVETADHVLPTMLDNYPCQKYGRDC
jgi:NADPH-dependent 2,4-dienoyl-CoA reductase/sulfur reductase-like enzyme